MKTVKTKKMTTPKMKMGGPMMVDRSMMKMTDAPMIKKGGAIMYKKGGALKKVDKTKNPGLNKLPKEVKNKMGYMKKGGSIKKKM
jgi:hypothetical protein